MEEMAKVEMMDKMAKMAKMVEMAYFVNMEERKMVQCEHKLILPEMEFGRDHERVFWWRWKMNSEGGN